MPDSEAEGEQDRFLDKEKGREREEGRNGNGKKERKKERKRERKKEGTNGRRKVGVCIAHRGGNPRYWQGEHDFA